MKGWDIELSDGLNPDQIMSDFQDIEYGVNNNKYMLPKQYALIKRIQNSIKDSLAFSSDVSVFAPLYTIVERIRKELGYEYELKKEVNSKVRNLRALIQENEQFWLTDHLSLFDCDRPLIEIFIFF